jgi:hypothetical protein
VRVSVWLYLPVVEDICKIFEVVEELQLLFSDAPCVRLERWWRLMFGRDRFALPNALQVLIKPAW